MAKPTKRGIPPPSRPASSLAPRNLRRTGRSDDAPGAPPTEPEEPEPESVRKLIIIFLVFFFVYPKVSILVYRLRYAANSTTQTSAEFPPREPQHHVKIDVGYQGILDENSRGVSENVSSRNLKNPVLAYITPCRGYGLSLEGRHNVDAGWISDLRAKGQYSDFTSSSFLSSFQRGSHKKKQRAKALRLIIGECKEMGYDRIVLESCSRWAAYGVLQDPNMHTLAFQFVEVLWNGLHAVESTIKQNGLQLVYVIGPLYSEKLELHDFGPADLQRLDKVVDGFSLMNYDFSNPRSRGPNVHLKWIQLTLHLLLGIPGNVDKKLARKLWIGLNFYGNDFVLLAGSGAITGANYLSLLQKHKPVSQWEKISDENFFLYTGDNNAKHAVFYPSLKSISLRLDEARSWGAGISIWEIEQGLDYFYDLLQLKRQDDSMSDIDLGIHVGAIEALECVPPVKNRY